ncbi:MAG TPA: hypothetical protein VJ716_02405 [Gaiellaceae bacterium]|nr:hypothetical protein [Gaiellaceae bacterium]
MQRPVGARAAGGQSGYEYRVRRCILIAALAAWLVLLPAAQGKRAPRIVTLRDNGARLTLRKGVRVQLRLTERYRWRGPRVRGRAVRLEPIQHLGDPGYLAWTVAARASGKAVVRAYGYGFGTRECGSHQCAARVFRVTFVVR